MTDQPKKPVPAGRISRLMRFGVMAGEIAVGAALEGVQRLTKPRGERSANALINVRSARAVADRLAQMRGAAMKLGQLLSMEGEDLLPAELSQVLARLRAGAYAMPATQLKRVLGREYGKDWPSRFAEFDWEPIAAASVGQVHRARARDGRDLALKIQYPGVAQSINGDIDNAAGLLRLVNLLPHGIDLPGMVKEAKRQLHEEVDYLREARNLQHFGALLARDHCFVVPRVHADLGTRRILAMDFVDSEPLESLGADGVQQKKRDRAGELLQQLMYRELFEFRCMQTDANAANYRYDRQTGRIVLLDFGSVREFSAEFIDRYARMSAATMEGNRGKVTQLAVEMGYLAADDNPRRTQATIDLLLLACEPLRHRGVYDFGRSDLGRRMGDETFLPALRRGEVRAPPPETMFLHRKLIGCFLLCAKIRARVDCRSLIAPYLRARNAL